MLLIVWNKIEHRLFCHITKNWRGRPLRTFETVVELIGHTETTTGLRVRAKLDKRTPIEVTREQLAEIYRYVREDVAPRFARFFP